MDREQLIKELTTQVDLLGKLKQSMIDGYITEHLAISLRDASNKVNQIGQTVWNSLFNSTK